LTDCDGENSETDFSLDFAQACRYITSEEHTELAVLSQEVGRMLGSMIKKSRLIPDSPVITAFADL
jgi:four helix bundle protein